MRFILIIIQISFLVSCSRDTNKELDCVKNNDSTLNNFIDSIKNTPLYYKTCKDCKLNQLEGEKLMGITARYSPHGNFDRKEIKIGFFKYDAFLILDNQDDISTNRIIFFCYLNQTQKDKFDEFLPYYSNLTTHHKEFIQVNYSKKNTVIIEIGYL